jgi:activator of 2-hydroxyglutaryl-CoA dehydratase
MIIFVGFLVFLVELMIFVFSSFFWVNFIILILLCTIFICFRILYGPIKQEKLKEKIQNNKKLILIKIKKLNLLKKEYQRKYRLKDFFTKYFSKVLIFGSKIFIKNYIDFDGDDFDGDDFDGDDFDGDDFDGDDEYSDFTVGQLDSVMTNIDSFIEEYTKESIRKSIDKFFMSSDQASDEDKIYRVSLELKEIINIYKKECFDYQNEGMDKIISSSLVILCSLFLLLGSEKLNKYYIENHVSESFQIVFNVSQNSLKFIEQQDQQQKQQQQLLQLEKNMLELSKNDYINASIKIACLSLNNKISLNDKVNLKNKIYLSYNLDESKYLKLQNYWKSKYEIKKTIENKINFKNCNKELKNVLN